MKAIKPVDKMGSKNTLFLENAFNLKANEIKKKIQQGLAKFNKVYNCCT